MTFATLALWGQAMDMTHLLQHMGHLLEESKPVSNDKVFLQQMTHMLQQIGHLWEKTYYITRRIEEINEIYFWVVLSRQPPKNPWLKFFRVIIELLLEMKHDIKLANLSNKEKTQIKNNNCNRRSEMNRTKGINLYHPRSKIQQNKNKNKGKIKKRGMNKKAETPFLSFFS
ncbi:hypothetical protein H5410_017269 [Solanum commersonii]|uniref:Uncharacterized protein n=1 Tax=Solanum commersonii TaxID=4109 RepID=A0A9J5ZYN8_SOLCO|nr:hypothetical protein H5410_017269 [Solanum commersonii]